MISDNGEQWVKLILSVQARTGMLIFCAVVLVQAPKAEPVQNTIGSLASRVSRLRAIWIVVIGADCTIQSIIIPENIVC